MSLGPSSNQMVRDYTPEAERTRLLRICKGCKKPRMFEEYFQTHCEDCRGRRGGGMYADRRCQRCGGHHEKKRQCASKRSK